MILGKIEEHNVNKITGVQYLHALYVETGTKGPHKFQNHLLGTSPLLGTQMSVRLNSKAGTIACGKGALPMGIWDTEGLDSILSVTLNMYPLHLHLPIYGVRVSLLLTPPWGCLCLHRVWTGRACALPSGSRDWAQSIPDGEAGRQWERPLGEAMGREVVRFFQSAPLHPAQPIWEERFQILQFAFNCLDFCLKHCPECISCSQSIHTCLFRFQYHFIDCSAQ